MSKDSHETTTSILGPDLEIEGNITSKGSVQIDGIVHGDVRATSIVVSNGATVEGSIRAETVSVWGDVKGQVNGRKVKLLRDATVSGDICYASLAIEEGASFEGKCRRSEDPVAEETKPAAKSERGFRPRTSSNRTERTPTRPRETPKPAASGATAAKPVSKPSPSQAAK